MIDGSNRVEKAHTLVLIVLITAFLIGYSAALKPIYDFDVDWHLAAGRWMVENGRFITQDPFSYTFRGREWVSITWLHELITWLLYSAGGDGLLVLVISIIPGLTILTLSLSTLLFLDKGMKVFEMDRFSVYSGILLACLIAAMYAQYRWAARPEIWSYMLGCMMVLLLGSYLLKPGNFIYLAIGVQLIWVNTHGIFILGPVLCVLVLGLLVLGLQFRRRVSVEELKEQLQAVKKMTIVNFGVVLICFANPRGLKGVLWPFHLFDVLKSKTFSLMIPEAIPPFGDSRWNHDSYVLFWIVLVYALVLLVHMLYSFGYKREPILGTLGLLSLFALALFCLTGYTAFSARRNIPLVLLWPFPFILFSLFRVIRPKTVMIMISLLLVTVLCLEGPALLDTKIKLMTSFRNMDLMPERTAGFVEDHAIFGPTFTTVSDANYFLRRLYGRFEPYIDSRFAELYDEEHFRRYMNILASPQLIEREVDRLRIDNVIVGHHLPLASALLRYLTNRPDRWLLVHVDEMAAVFVKRGASRYAAWSEQTASELAARIQTQTSPDVLTGDSLERLTGLGRGLALTNYYPQSYAVFEHAAQRDPENYEAIAGFCNISWMNCTRVEDNESFGDCATKSLTICEQAMALSPESLQAVIATGIVNRALNNLTESERLFRKATEIDSHSYEAFMHLANTLVTKGQTLNSIEALFEAAETYWQAARLRPFDYEPFCARAEIMLALELPHDAEMSFREALARTSPGPIHDDIRQRLSELGAVPP
ncbi:hypothetical protein JXQ70_08930 [bacterium]|nr:hypothetical protein [bacterium]